MKIYTKSGDKGMTHFYGGKSIPKDHPIVECYGTVDELNALIGLVLANPLDGGTKKILEDLQYRLFDLGADLAAPFGEPSKSPTEVIRISQEDVSRLEKTIDSLSAVLPTLTHFILPGGTSTAAMLHFARAVCRRAERLFVKASSSHALNPQALIFLNRLSDLLFVLGRSVNYQSGTTEWVWPKAE
ncbi:MAG: cob(I)yrinic acid a,c-diamide adenosyltransferase [Deltaproteobacteria bacterium]|nr:cob(I)yrinic acid a,c-diamide adenosyltransferase [Deltaproteobacteria bacterium]